MKKIRITLRAFDHRVLDRAIKEIMQEAKGTGASILGPIPFPTRREIKTVLRSPHIDRKAQDQFERLTYKRALDVTNCQEQTIKALMQINISPEVEVKIKV